MWSSVGAERQLSEPKTSPGDPETQNAKKVNSIPFMDRPEMHTKRSKYRLWLRDFQTELCPRKRSKNIILIICFVALVIIENEIVWRVTEKLTHRQTINHQDTFLLLNAQFYADKLDITKPFLDPSQTGKKHILLFTTTRTGSSFVGEFFNQLGTDMFYLFEPLFHVNRTLALMTDDPNHASIIFRNVLLSLFLCDFSLLEKFLRPRPVNHVSPFLFRGESSESLCEEQVCSPVKRFGSPRFICRLRLCGPLNFTLASESCLKKQYRAIKTVRIQHLHSLRLLIEDPRLDVKIIHLVRDPRAVQASRIVALRRRYNKWKRWAEDGKVPYDDEEVKKLQIDCDQILESAKLGLSQPDWLENRYMLVRYEDVAKNPMEKAAEMCNFTGIPFTAETRKWISNNINASEGPTNVFSTYKNSTEHVEKWRFSIPFKIAKVVQEVCGPTMEMFGYRIADSEETLRNKSISLIEEKQFNVLY